MPVFDSDVLIDVLRDYPGAKRFLMDFNKDENLISVMTYGEVLFGMRDVDAVRTEIFLSHFRIIPADKDVVDIAHDIKSNAKGHNLELFDCIIAATALNRSMPLVTRNRRHYPDKRLKVITPGY